MPKRSPRPRPLTEAEALTLTRGEILDRLVAESDWWTAHPVKTDADRQAYATFSRILHSSIDPAAAIQDAMDHVQGQGAGSYWETRPGERAAVEPAPAAEPEAEP